MAVKTSARAAKPHTRQPASRRVEKVEATRRQLFDAALKVVGESGYAGSSIAKIASRAKVAQGTFYNYFTSQQDVFDQLLPYLGERLLNRIREQLKGCKDAYEREAIGFRAYFDFLSENPEFERILSEAAVFTPQGFRNHVQNIVSGYMRAFRYSRARGVLPHYSEAELEAVTYMLLGARAYLSQRYIANGNGRAAKLPKVALNAYIKFMRYGLTGPRRASNGSSRAHDPVTVQEAASEPEVVLIESDSVTVRAQYDAARMALPALLASMTATAAREALLKPGQELNISHFSCSIVGREPAGGSTIFALAHIEGHENGPRSISVSYRMDDNRDRIFASALMTVNPNARPGDHPSH